jgi:hypothetical protein
MYVQLLKGSVRQLLVVHANTAKQDLAQAKTNKRVCIERSIMKCPAAVSPNHLSTPANGNGKV